MIMKTTTEEKALQDVLEIRKEVEIAARIELAFEARLEDLGPESKLPAGQPFPLKTKPSPGGRWYRDLGSNSGHFWGHVQVIKPPTLLEICGPMFMSYPAINLLPYRLQAEGNGSRITLFHRALGRINPEHRDGV